MKTYKQITTQRLSNLKAECNVKGFTDVDIMEKIGVNEKSNFTSYWGGYKIITDTLLHKWCVLLEIDYEKIASTNNQA